MQVLEVCGQSILVVAQHLLQFSLQVNFVRIGFRVGWTGGAVDDVDDGATKDVAGGFELAAVVVGKLLGCRQLLPFGNLVLIAAGFLDGVLPHIIRVPRLPS